MTYINERLSVVRHSFIFIIVIYDDESEDEPQIFRVYQTPLLWNQTFKINPLVYNHPTLVIQSFIKFDHICIDVYEREVRFGVRLKKVFKNFIFKNKSYKKIYMNNDNFDIMINS